MDSEAARTTFTLLEAAALLQVHPETLRRAIKADELLAAKIGKEYRISKTDLEAYWTAKGGGALFDDSPRPQGLLSRPGRKKKQPRRGPEQLTLLPQTQPPASAGNPGSDEDGDE
ncbi:helix-turn-helix domain-containing protein [Megalodesulfovibrio paquesii]